MSNASPLFLTWYYDWGDDLVKKKDGTPIRLRKVHSRNHPCTINGQVKYIQYCMVDTTWMCFI